jgi:hypothetical protein
MGFGEALIVSAAQSRATRILSEGLSAGQRVSGVLIENPCARPRDSKSPTG